MDTKRFLKTKEELDNIYNKDEAIDFEEIKLISFSFYAIKRFSKEFLYDYITKTDIDNDYYYLNRGLNSLILSIHGKVYGEKDTKYEFSFPSDWWQHFKLSCFPKWIIKLFPIKYRKIIIDADVIYPNIKPSIPKEDHHIVFIKGVPINLESEKVRRILKINLKNLKDYEEIIVKKEK